MHKLHNNITSIKFIKLILFKTVFRTEKRLNGRKLGKDINHLILMDKGNLVMIF